MKVCNWAKPPVPGIGDGAEIGNAAIALPWVGTVKVPTSLFLVYSKA